MVHLANICSRTTSPRIVTNCAAHHRETTLHPMFRTPAFVSGPYVKPSPSKKPKVDLENKEARKKKEKESRRKKVWQEKPVPPVVKTYMSNMKAYEPRSAL